MITLNSKLEAIEQEPKHRYHPQKNFIYLFSIGISLAKFLYDIYNGQIVNHFFFYTFLFLFTFPFPSFDKFSIRTENGNIVKKFAILNAFSI